MHFDHNENATVFISRHMAAEKSEMRGENCQDYCADFAGQSTAAVMQ